VAFDVALIACPVMQFYCGTPMYLLSGVDTKRSITPRPGATALKSGLLIHAALTAATRARLGPAPLADPS